MRQLGIFSVVTMIFLSANTWAQQSATPAAPAAAGGADVRVYQGFGLRINGGPDMVSSQVAGTGLNASTPKSFGTNYGGTMTYGLSSAPVIMFGSYESYTAKHEDVAGVTPNSFNQTHVRSDIGFLAHENVSPSEGFFQAGLGYFFEVRETDRMSPVVAAGQQLSGPTALLGYTSGTGGKSFCELNASFGFPNAFKEQNTVSGNYSFGLSSTLSFKVVYVYTEQLDLSIGLLGKYDVVQYSGTGSGISSRGVADASETFTSVAVPFELRFKF